MNAFFKAINKVARSPRITCYSSFFLGICNFPAHSDKLSMTGTHQMS